MTLGKAIQKLFMSNNNSHTPRPRRLPVNIRVDKNTVGMFFDSEIMNLSKGGVFMRADITMPLGSLVQFDFTLPKSKKKVQAKGIVVWARAKASKSKDFYEDHPYGMGIEFKDIALEDVESILDEIELSSK